MKKGILVVILPLMLLLTACGGTNATSAAAEGSGRKMAQETATEVEVQTAEEALTEDFQSMVVGPQVPGSLDLPVLIREADTLQEPTLVKGDCYLLKPETEYLVLMDLRFLPFDKSTEYDLVAVFSDTLEVYDANVPGDAYGCLVITISRRGSTDVYEAIFYFDLDDDGRGSVDLTLCANQSPSKFSTKPGFTKDGCYGFTLYTGEGGSHQLYGEPETSYGTMHCVLCPASLMLDVLREEYGTRMPPTTD